MIYWVVYIQYIYITYSISATINETSKAIFHTINLHPSPSPLGSQTDPHPLETWHSLILLQWPQHRGAALEDMPFRQVIGPDLIGWMDGYLLTGSRT